MENKIYELCRRLSGKNISIEDELIESRILDSFRIIELMSELENLYQIEFTQEEITQLENFSTVKKITRTVMEKMKMIQSKYLITGATGYIGSMLAGHLMQQNMYVAAIVRDVDKARRMLPELSEIISADLTDREAMENISGDYDYIIHCASMTKSEDMINRPLEVTESIVDATRNVCELALRSHVKSMVYLSSMEVYGRIEMPENRKCTEEDAPFGVVDIHSARSCYPLAKRMAENICCCYCREYGLPVKIARPAQTFGKGVLSSESRIFAQLARCAVENRDIVLHTEGNSMGNYCDIEDAVEGILTVLLKGGAGEAYNIVNESCTMRIRQMAELVCKLAGGKISVKTDIPESNIYGYAEDTELRLSSEKLRKLGWIPRGGMEDMYRDMIDEMRQQERI